MLIREKTRMELETGRSSPRSRTLVSTTVTAAIRTRIRGIITRYLGHVFLFGPAEDWLMVFL